MILPEGYSDIPVGKIAAVVTHLEMRAARELPSDPPGSWTFRRVEAPDLDWYRDLHRRVGADWLWVSRLRLSDAELAAIIHADGVEHYTLEQDGRAEAQLELDFRKPGDCEIVYFGVTAQLIGTGAARFLMNRALRRAWSQGGHRVWLHTCTFDSPRALAFYERSGFCPFCCQVEVIDDPRLDGALPRHVAPHVPLIV